MLSKTISPALITAQKTKNGTEISEKKTQKPNFSNSDETVSENGAKTALNVHVQGKIFIHTLPYINKCGKATKKCKKNFFPLISARFVDFGDE